jgi:hypothetical protein
MCEASFISVDNTFTESSGAAVITTLDVDGDGDLDLLNAGWCVPY